MAKRSAKSNIVEERETNPWDLQGYALYDSKTKQYNLPSYYMNDHEARRAAELMFTDPNQRESMPVKCPQDYSLFHIGTYDRFTGTFQPEVPIRHIVNMHEIKAYLENQPKG